MSALKFPIGIQDFEKIISNNYLYIDKTELIYRLASQHSPFFLSRPRRFGKSLLISTLYALFSAKRDLFKGLWIDQSDWTWTSYPVIFLDMSTINNETPEQLERALIHALEKIGLQHHLSLIGETPSDYLSDLIEKMMQAYGQHVVILIDEYDKALIDNLDNIEVAQKNREILRRFYTILKAYDSHLRFLLLTGITNFSKVSIFSGLNNLIDLTMLDEYSMLLGYTKEELESYFLPAIQEVANTNSLTQEDCSAQIKEWYNGYQFSKNGQLVYNPFSTLMLFYYNNFSDYWYESGTPTFLIKLIQKREFDLIKLEKYEVAAKDFSVFEIEELSILPLLYQTGYLTIKAYNPVLRTFRLGFPNREVNQSFSNSLLSFFAISKASAADHLSSLYNNLSTPPWDFSSFFEILSELLALMPYDLYLKNEKHYHSLFYLILKLTGINVNAEVHTQKGRVDLAIEMKDKIIIFEFKLNKTAKIAIEQIKEKSYYKIYQDRKVTVYLVGVNFNSQLRAIDDWHVEQLPVNYIEKQ